MCGIFGVINLDGKPVDKEKVLSARDVLAHRGPDDSGFYESCIHTSIQPCIALAHRRLSIIDLSPAGHQPMVSDDACLPARQGRYTIVFNGEIFNYHELQEAVRSKKLEVRSQSDTEVILKLFELEGPECLKRLRGMFAFAIWDDKEKKLFATRDRFGIKPFYYLYNNNEFIFSSELKAIKHYKNGLTLSMKGMDAFLRTGSVPAPLTIYEETNALLSGHWLEVVSHPEQSRRISINKYWSFSDLLYTRHTSTGLSMTSDDSVDLSLRSGNSRRSNLKYDDNAKKIIHQSLLESINAHLVSDVEVGAFLSGGIDSTAIVSLMRQAGQEKIKTISVTFPGHQLDESKYSNLAAKKYNTDHFEYRLQEDELINDFDKIIEAMDQPTIDGINTYFVSKAAASFGLKVVLSGLGGDELFGGYQSFINIPKYQRIKNFPFAKTGMKVVALALKNYLPAKAIEYFKNPDEPNAEYKLFRGLFTDAELKSLGWQLRSQQSEVSSQWLNPNQSMTNDPLTNDLLTNNQFANDLMTNLQHVSYLESCVYMRNQLLRDSDVFSMIHSLEKRVPFVDHLLYGSVLPYLDSGFDRSFPKKILVEAVGDLPDEIVYRQKQGFTFPFSDWIKQGKMKEIINDSLNSSKLKNYFNTEQLLNLRKSFEKNKIHWSRVWAMFIFSQF